MQQDALEDSHTVAHGATTVSLNSMVKDLLLTYWALFSGEPAEQRNVSKTQIQCFLKTLQSYLHPYERSDEDTSGWCFGEPLEKHLE